MVEKIINFLFGQPSTHQEMFESRISLCKLAGKNYKKVKNFWKTIEHLRPVNKTKGIDELQICLKGKKIKKIVSIDYENGLSVILDDGQILKIGWNSDGKGIIDLED